MSQPTDPAARLAEKPPRADELDEKDIDMLLERFDQTEPRLQRRIIAQFVINAAHYQAALAAARAEVERAKAEYGVLRDAIWDVPGEGHSDSSNMDHESTRRQAVDQALAFEHVNPLRARAESAERERNALRAGLEKALDPEVMGRTKYVKQTCPDCKGDGESPASLCGACLPCPTCRGEGEINIEKGKPLTLKEAIEKARGGPPPTPFQGFA